MTDPEPKTMRIAFLCKRLYMSKDVIADRYARLYEIPHQLARLGHDVQAFCLAYRGEENGSWEHEARPGRLRWQSRNLGRNRTAGILTYPHALLGKLREFNPDVLISASDIPHIALGAWLAGKLGVPYVADLYDNFETFGQARIPGFVKALRWGIRRADLVTTTSEPLREFVIGTCKAHGTVVAMPSAVDLAVFHPRDKQTCRKNLKLPANAQLIGTAGGLTREKGIHTLFSAWGELVRTNPDVHLVLAGPIEAETPLPTGERVHYLGMLCHEQVAELFSALDVGVMCIPDTPFGRFCFPQKAYEMLACQLPTVAADIGAISALFVNQPQYLYIPGDPRSLARKISVQISASEPAKIIVNDWKTLIAELNAHLPKANLPGRQQSSPGTRDKG